jgi:hypothetical protein
MENIFSHHVTDCDFAVSDANDKNPKERWYRRIWTKIDFDVRVEKDVFI